jgi:hypothetical protein
MSEMKWSPAPWIAVGPDENIHIVQEGNPDMRVCFMTSNGPCVANAHLIASAPDLAKALEAATHALRSYQYGNASTELAMSVADFCDVALAKARGEVK